MEKATRRWLWELNGSWRFETSADGAILYFPHGWGCAYVVATEEKRREMESFLVLWLKRLRAAIRASIWFALAGGVVLFATIAPPFCRAVWEISDWAVILRYAFLVAALACLIPPGSQLALIFLAETAKAELEKAHIRRPLIESLRDYALRSDWRRIWIKASASAFVPLDGLWLLWPRRDTVMVPAHINAHLAAAGMALILIGGVMTLFTLWQIRAKLRS